MSRAVYRPSQRALHWLVALLVIAQIPLGLLIEGYEQPTVDAVNRALGDNAFNTLYDLHKSIGLTVLGLMILRVVARARHGAPEHADPLSLRVRLASGAVHVALYVLLIVTPIVGWWGVSAYPAPVPFWFLFDAALPVAPDRGLSNTLLGSVHGPLGILVGILAIVHVLAALRHRLIERDAVMSRMTG